MLFIMTLWKIFLMILNYCLLKLTVYAMRYVMNALMNNFRSIKNLLIEAITVKIRNIFVMIIKKYLVKWKMNMEEI